ncbi:MAG: HAD family hydrolase [Pseudomonadota bacterium]|nr:HAD family hydrolase [Pseudomonadota bacterium]
MTLRVDAILFDKDGTLFDFDATWTVWANTVIDRLSQGDPALADAIAEAVDFDRASGRFRPASVVIAGTPDDVAEAVAPVLGIEPATLIAGMNAAAATAPMAQAVPLAPLLDDLRGLGLKLGVATNDGEGPARSHLASAGVTEAFDFIAGSDSGWAPKPDPAMCLAFAEAMGLAPERIAMVGDSLHDLVAARTAGMQAIAVLTGLADEARLAQHADVVLPDIGHLSGWVRL